MRITIISFMFAVGISASAFAQDSGPIAVSVESLSNVSGNGSLEACGTAIHKDGIKPLMVTLKHDESYYTTLTGPNGKWCVVFKRWTFDGKIDVSATTLQNPSQFSFQEFQVSPRD